MSYFDDASLVMIPSGYKTSKVYSVKPTDGSGDLTFTRSNDTATRVGPDGLIEKVRTNLVLHSQDLTNATWQKLNTSVSGNTTTSPDGTLTADTLVEAATSNIHIVFQNITIASGVEYTFSTYAKYNGRVLQINASSALFGNFAFANFDLQNGVLGTIGSTASASITSVGNGWYRCAITCTSTAGGSGGMATALVTTTTAVRNESYLGDGTSGAFLWGCQSETGVLTDYIATTTAAVSVGPVANVPRLDYLGSSCPRLLLEPQRTNLALYSEQIDNAGWTKASYTISANAATSPDGYVNSDKLIPNSGASLLTISVHALQLFTKAASAIQYTYSVFAKDSGLDRIQIFVNGTSVSNNAQATFSLANGSISTAATSAGTFSGASASVTDYGNGWYRCALVFTTNTDTTLIVRNIATDSTLTTGNGTDGIFVWGAQLEAGAYATSYIPTLGAAVTRGADAASKTGISSLIGQTEGTIFWEFNIPSIVTAGTYTRVILSDGTSSNTIDLIFYPNGRIQFTAFVAGSNVVNINLVAYGLTAGNHKFALAYKLNDYVAYVDGALVGADTSATVPVTSDLSLYSTVGGSSLLNQALLFKTRLTNAQLAELTA